MLKLPFMIASRIDFIVFNDIKMKVWKFENKSRAYFRRGLFSESFSCSDLGGLFSGGLFSRGLIFGIIQYLNNIPPSPYLYLKHYFIHITSLYCTYQNKKLNSVNPNSPWGGDKFVPPNL